MINIRCGSTGSTLTLSKLQGFQGTLKKRTEKDIDAMCETLLNDGLIMPFAVWDNNGTTYLIDGHGRKMALVKLALEDPTILEQEFPVIVIQAVSEDEARKALLQVVSTYGRINKPGVVEFAAPISNYKAPVINFTQREVKRPKVVEKVIVRIAVPREMVEQLTGLLASVDGVELL